MIEFYANLTSSSENPSFSVDKVLAEYQRLRTERPNKFENMVTGLRRFLALAPAFQTQKEWCMDSESWMTYFEENHPAMLKRYQALVQAGLSTDPAAALNTWNAWRTRVRNLHFDRLEAVGPAAKASTNLQYALRLTNFGIYNCDQIFRLSDNRATDFVYSGSGYKTSDGRPVKPNTVCMLDRESKMFLTIKAPVWLAGRQIEVVLLGNDGRRYRLSAESYARMEHPAFRNSGTLVVEDITDKTRTPREWADLLDL